jgi:hypothetical protein
MVIVLSVYSSRQASQNKSKEVYISLLKAVSRTKPCEKCPATIRVTILIIELCWQYISPKLGKESEGREGEFLKTG